MKTALTNKAYSAVNVWAEIGRLEADLLRFRDEVVRSLRQIERDVRQLQAAVLAEREPVVGGERDSRSASAAQPGPAHDAKKQQEHTPLGDTAVRGGGARLL